MTLPSPATPLNDWKKKTITLILVGETGVGKTSLLSLLANVCACRKLDDFQLEHDARNESNLSRDQSQTNNAVLYTFHHTKGRVLRVIDTPGLGDTRGVDQDIQHTESIVKAIQSAIETVDGVLFMANGTLERAGPGIEYTMHMLSAIFPRSMAKNIGLLFTNVPDALSFNFHSNSLPAYIAKSELWTIQNPLAQLMRFREMEASMQSEKQILTFRKLLENSYSSTIETLNDIFAWLDRLPAQKTHPILALYLMSQGLEIAVQNVISQGTLRDGVQARITRLQTELVSQNQVCQRHIHAIRSSFLVFAFALQTINANREHSTTLNRQMWEQTSTYGINVLCTKDGCYQNCQTGCSGTFSLDPDKIRQKSSAFGWGRAYYCRVCHHHYSDHRHFRAKWEKKSTTKYVADHAARRRLQAAQVQVSKNMAEQHLAQNDLRQSELELRRLELTLRRSCIDFRGLSLARCFSDHLASTVRLLEVRLSAMRSGQADAAASKRMEVIVEAARKKLTIVKAAEGK